MFETYFSSKRTISKKKHTRTLFKKKSQENILQCFLVFLIFLIFFLPPPSFDNEWKANDSIWLLMRSPISLFTAVCIVTYVLRNGVSTDCPFSLNESGIDTLYRIICTCTLCTYTYICYMTYRTLNPGYTLPYIPIRILYHTKLQTQFAISRLQPSMLTTYCN